VAAGVLLITLAWIRYNVLIYRRKGPRHGAVEASAVTDRDRLGRHVAWDVRGGPEAARDAHHLVVDRDGEAKRYRAPSGS
jgi:hypothetical protein